MEILFIIQMLLSFVSGQCEIAQASSMQFEGVATESTYVECRNVGYIVFENNRVADWGP